MAHTDSVVARLLVAVPDCTALRSSLRRSLPRVAWGVIGPASAGPWPNAEALLIGQTSGVLPISFPHTAPKLRFVQSIFTGLDDFPFSRFGQTVRVSGNVGAYAAAVAEHAVMLVLVLAKNFSPNLDRLRKGELRPLPPNTILRGRTVLLLGYGSVARRIASPLRVMGMRIEGLSRTRRAEPGTSRMFLASELRGAASKPDVVIDCRPLTQLTRGTIDRPILESMQRDAILVVVGRAGTVDEEALYRHLRANPTFRAGTDVWWHEDLHAGRLGRDQRFLRLPNFVGTPHSAGYSLAMEPAVESRAYDMAMENLARFFGGKVPRHLADRREYDAPVGLFRRNRPGRGRGDENPGPHKSPRQA